MASPVQTGKTMDCESNLPIIVYFSGPGGKIWLAGAAFGRKKKTTTTTTTTTRTVDKWQAPAGPKLRQLSPGRTEITKSQARSGPGEINYEVISPAQTGVNWIANLMSIIVQ